VYFEGDHVQLPKIYDSLKVKRPDGAEVILEVQQHIGEDTAASVAMDSTDGLHADRKWKCS